MSMPATQIPSSITLKDLLGGIAEAPDILIHGIANDTRELCAGSAVSYTHLTLPTMQ